MTVSSRRGSAQIRHSSSDVTLPHTEQKRTLSFTSVSVCASRRTSAGSAASRWNAIRWALFGPIPGSRPSSSMRSWMAHSYMGCLHAGQPEGAAEGVQAAGERANLLGRKLLGVVDGVAYRGDANVGVGLV